MSACDGLPIRERARSMLNSSACRSLAMAQYPGSMCWISEWIFEEKSLIHIHAYPFTTPSLEDWKMVYGKLSALSATFFKPTPVLHLKSFLLTFSSPSVITCHCSCIAPCIPSPFPLSGFASVGPEGLLDTTHPWNLILNFWLFSSYLPNAPVPQDFLSLPNH